MSRVSELAAAEAAAAEAEQPDEDEEEQAAEEEQAGQPAEPEPAAEPGHDAEALAKQLDREASRHERAVAKIVGAELPLTPCAMCDSLGYMPPGSEVPPAADWTRTCPACAGHGVRLTGSRVPASLTVECRACGGRGFQERTETPAPTGVQLASSEPAAGNGAEQWGVPAWMGDPNIGRGG